MKILAKTSAHLEDVLEKEIIELGGKNITKTKRGVWYEGDTELLYKSNLWLRSAMRVITPIYEFTAYDDRRLYKHVYDFDWTPYISLDKTFAIDSVTKSHRFKHSQFVALRIKDAIVDQFRDKFDKRPSINPKHPEVLLNVHLNNAKFTISLDSSGETLNKRGYRVTGHPASLNESLAAGLILMTDWRGESDLIDPFCGSGTIPFEAAMIASNYAPGQKRRFAFMNWKNFDKSLWLKLKEEAQKTYRKPEHKIIGSDQSEKAINIARKSLEDLRFSDSISFRRLEFDLQSKSSESGTIITNPPYGERLKEDNIIEFYKKIGDNLKQNFTNWDAWILSGNLTAIKHLGLRTSSKNNVVNGDLDCKFNKYEMYKGSKK